jgi:hypothetical protein
MECITLWGKIRGPRKVPGISFEAIHIQFSRLACRRVFFSFLLTKFIRRISFGTILKANVRRSLCSVLESYQRRRLWRGSGDCKRHVFKVLK